VISAANTDFIQATIELFGMIMTFVLGAILFIITGNKKQSEKNLFVLIILSGLALLVDAGWYIFDGNTKSYGYVINWICNFSIFIINPCTICFANGYLYHLIKERGYEVKKTFMLLAFLFSTLAALMPISNLFIKWMYYIDQQNIYHRLTGWYFYTAFNSIAIIMYLCMVFTHRKCISNRQKVWLYIFLLAPLWGVLLQMVTIGISFVQIGVAIGCVGILSSYLIDWIMQENETTEVSEDKKRFWLIECVFMFMILCISASIISCAVSVNDVSNQNSKQNSLAMAYMVSGTISDVISEPIHVSKTLADSQTIIDALCVDTLEGSAEEAKMIAFMKRIEEEFGYQNIFVASEKTKAYYTYEGLSRYMDVENDVRDAWYNEYKERKIPYELNIDTDKDNDMELAVFVNMEVKDEEGNFVGVCGVGMSLESLMELLSDYEEGYDLDVLLTNPDGLIQIATDRELIENTKVDNSDFNKMIPGECIYLRNENQVTMIKYMDNMNWYLIVNDNKPDKLNVIKIILPSMVIYVIGIILLLMFMAFFGIRDRNQSEKLQSTRRLSETDPLTELKNRHALDLYIENIEKNGMPEVFTVIMMDINGLKEVNDSVGHDAGDELIKAASDCIIGAFKNKGDAYRIGGDEFIVTCLCGIEEVKEMLADLTVRTANWKGDQIREVSISVGFASNETNKDETFFELSKAADELMYANKNAYYEKTGKDRRSH